jgi:SAM-dependent methyltransferase
MSPPFYQQQQIPAHSVLLMTTREQAVNYPRGNLSLAYCPACGFVTNTAFDAALNDYSPEYEETQHFSDCFNSFASRLIDRLISDYHIDGNRILEIGCGKGEFLAELCARSNSTGIGIDPSSRPERIESAIAQHVQFIPELYSEKHATLQADVIMCRHTLEHIQPVNDFLTTIRRTVDDNSEALIVFEVPDVEIVLNQRRFWDVYYEHCSYFTADSLTRLFEATGFDVVECFREYDDQYLLLIARPASGEGTGDCAAPADVEELNHTTQAFGRQVASDIIGWLQQLRQSEEQGQTTVIWGGGSKCVAFLTTLMAVDAASADQVAAVVDINPHKSGKFIPGTGHRVISPDQLVDYAPDSVIVMNSVYLEEIRRDLDRLGLKPTLTGL